MPSLPDVDGSEDLDELAWKLRGFFMRVVDTPHDWEDLRREKYAKSLRPLVCYLAEETHHELAICALLALKWQFTADEREDERGLYETRGLACELVAWRVVTYLSHDEALSQLCSDIPVVVSPGRRPDQAQSDVEAARLLELDDDCRGAAAGEVSPLLPSLEDSFHEDHMLPHRPMETPSYGSVFAGLNALEIAVVVEAKKFLRQRPIQRIIDGIWTGDIVFWETLGVHSTKQARVYSKTRSDPFCRLRVPLYLKVFEAWFFAAFLMCYYAVLVQNRTEEITVAEIMLYIWLASFAYNELGEFWDAGSKFYAADFWSLWDVGIIVTGIAFFIARVIGLVQGDSQATVTAFNILSVEALFLVPRLCSLLSLHPYFGMLIPALKEMTKDFMKFLGLVVILYLGFTTCFAFLARGMFSFQYMNWILIKVFFGSSYLGFDISEKISPVFAPVLMVLFVALTNVLLITSMISLLSNTLTKFMQHARDQYLFVYAVFVLEASTSNRLTYFLPPLIRSDAFQGAMMDHLSRLANWAARPANRNTPGGPLHNLVPLLCLRPLRLLAPAQAIRTVRIKLLKATHWPFVALILGYEAWRRYFTPIDGGHGGAKRATTWGSSVSSRLRHTPSPASLLRRPRSRMAAHGASRSRMDEQAREARPTTARSSDMHDRAEVGRAGLAAAPTTSSSTETATAGVAEMAVLVNNLRAQVEQLTNMIAAMGNEPKETAGRRGREDAAEGE